MNFLKKYPLPITGTALGLAALGNLIRNYSEGARSVLGIIACILLVIALIKILSDIPGFKKAMENPVMAGTMSTFPMTVMVLSTYAPQPVGKALWYTGYILQTIYVLWYLAMFVLKFDIKKVFPTWFVALVGIAVAPLTSLPHKTVALAMPAFWFAFIVYLILIPLVTYRVVKIGNIPDMAKPTMGIYAAPASLLLAAYASAAPSKNMTILYFLMFLSALFYIVGLFQLKMLFTMKFIPSFSGFTFPFVISAMAMKMTAGFLKKQNMAIPALANIVKVQEVLAVVLVLYVLIRFIMLIMNTADDKK